MITTQVQLRRGNASENAVFTGAQGEITVDLTNNRSICHDGFTQGGWTGANLDDIGPVISSYGIVYVSGDQVISGTKEFGIIHAAAIESSITESEINLNDSIMYDKVNGFSSIDWDIRTLNDEAQSITVDWQNHVLSCFGQPALDWRYGIFYDNDFIHAQRQSLNTNTRVLTSRPSNFVSQNTVDWQNCLLTSSGNTLTLDWANTILTGNWKVQSQTIVESIYYAPKINPSSITLSNSPFYINTGIGANILWTLPLSSQNTGKFYYIKNKGSNLQLTGQSNDKFFGGSLVLSYPVNSGEAYVLASDGSCWNMM